MLLIAIDEPLDGGRGHPDRIVVGSHPAGECIDENESRHPVRIGGGECDRHRPALGVADHDRLVYPGGIQHESAIVHPHLDRGNRVQGDRVGHARPAFVEAHDLAE